jgi:hypothetical protein
MSASSVIGDVTETLQDLLINGQQPPGMFDVSLISPADVPVPPGGGVTVNLFLFRVVENQFAKNQEWLQVGTELLSYPPLALNLFYVLTPFAVNRLDEHRALGEAMRVFYNNSIIKEPRLSGALAGSAEELKLDLCQLSIEDLTRIWNALNRPYRLSVCYEVRIALIDSLFAESTTRVIEKQNEFV